ncbi:MAG: hypothetical protein ACLUNZ_01315 [Evtepia sp.]
MESPASVPPSHCGTTRHPKLCNTIELSPTDPVQWIRSPCSNAAPNASSPRSQRKISPS